MNISVISHTATFTAGVVTSIILGRYIKSSDDDHTNQIFANHQSTSKQRPDDRGHSLEDLVNSKRWEDSVKKAEQICERLKTKYGLPGLSVGVSVNGATQWQRGFGFADLENEVPMSPNSVVRIGSISKSMTMGMLGQMLEEGKIDLDLPIQTYVPDFPKKEVNGQQVTITTRDLLSHLSGIRHYATKEQLDKNPQILQDEMSLKEYFLKEKYESVEKALEMFKNDRLLYEPGKMFSYTTHGWTLVSAVMEKIAGIPFEKQCFQIFKLWGLQHTYLDEPEPLILNRVRPYCWAKKKRIIQNADYVDNSYKWAGGGFLSTVGDLLQFGNIMLSSYQNCPSPRLQDIGVDQAPGAYLKSETMMKIWKPDNRTQRPGNDLLYGLGWYIGYPMEKCFFCESRDFMVVSHGGAAIGGSSVLLMTFPKDFRFGVDETDKNTPASSNYHVTEPIQKVKGVTVVLLTNLTDVGGLKVSAQEISKQFEWLI